ncbi:MAG: hypothetical protein KVP17_002652 [Porospora cf. gigantea B]|uniref:uncharacterized protein n=1 Tax=Porospora cf. gigantea B TaxID=2853592 RepID=UPI003571A695|nr:MAG: hypothetical protein KVP17_002652 [Porospora cf. gigantea B]
MSFRLRGVLAAVACWARFTVQVSYDSSAAFVSPYEDPVYFTGLPTTDIATAVAVPVSETAVRVVKLRAAGGCPVVDLNSSAAIPLLIGAAGGWMGGDLPNATQNAVLFAKYEIPSSQVNLAGGNSPLLNLTDPSGANGDILVFEAPPVIVAQVQYRDDDFHVAAFNEPLYDVKIFDVTRTSADVGIFASSGSPQRDTIVVGLMAFVSGNVDWTPVLRSSAIVAESESLPYYLPSANHAGNCANPLLFASNVESDGAVASYQSERGFPFKPSLAGRVRT